MATPLYLAMTAAEYHSDAPRPSHIAWMACHFSPYALGLSNMPEELPSDSLLILSDIIPIHGHDPHVIARELSDCIGFHSCQGLLLDFQRAPCAETEALTDILIQACTTPVAVAEPFARCRNCPVFLPPCPPHIPLKEYIAPWEDREIWLEAASSPTRLMLTPSGAEVFQEEKTTPETPVFSDKRLHCHYHTQVKGTDVRFHLWRTADDLDSLMEEGSALGIRQFVGLYQEFSAF